MDWHKVSGLRARNACVLLLGMGVAACSGPADPPKVALPQPQAFVACLACHQVKAGANGIGPSLSGLAGQSAGRVSGFTYSQAFENADFVWDRETMAAYLLNPSAKVPGNKMMFGGLTSEQEARQVADYVLSLP